LEQPVPRLGGGGIQNEACVWGGGGGKTLTQLGGAYY
jgi:hypothetical protein